MAKRCNLTTIPDEVYELIEKDGMSRSESVPQTILRVICDHYLSGPTSSRHEPDVSTTRSRRVADNRVKPPTEQEANAERVAKGYHFSLAEFMAHYGRQGWKLGNGRPMKDWKLTMVTWEERWKERQGGASVGRQEYDTSGNAGLVEALKNGKGW